MHQRHRRAGRQRLARRSHHGVAGPADFYKGFDTQIDATQLCPTSEMLAQFTGQGPQPNKAIIGKNAFAHESGIHQDGVLKDTTTYEIMTPLSVGRAESKLVMGKHSGATRCGSSWRRSATWWAPTTCWKRSRAFKNVADHKKEVFEEDLHAIMESLPSGIVASTP